MLSQRLSLDMTMMLAEARRVRTVLSVILFAALRIPCIVCILLGSGMVDEP